MKLTEIISKYGLEKGPKAVFDSNGNFIKGWGTDKDTEHSYCEYYENALFPFIDKDVDVLEIGSHFGGSAILWYEYLPKSKLVLMDIEEYLSAKCWDIFDKDRFIYVNCDAYTTTNGEKVKELKPNGFDIIFEDGPHTLQSQIATLEIYLKQLKTGGKLFMEDIQSVDDFDKLEEVVKEMDGKYETERIDLRENKNRYDDLIFVVGKK